MEIRDAVRAVLKRKGAEVGDLVNWIMSAQGHAIEQLQNYVTGRYPYS